MRTGGLQKPSRKSQERARSESQLSESSQTEQYPSTVASSKELVNESVTDPPTTAVESQSSHAVDDENASGDSNPPALQSEADTHEEAGQ